MKIARRRVTAKQSPQKKRDVKPRTILEVAAKLFSERGFTGTNMRDVAKALDVSRSAVYYYFDSKEAILSALVDEVTVYSEQQAASVADFKTEPVEALYEMVRNHAAFVLQNPLIFRVIERGENDLDQKAKAISKRAKRALMDKFRLTIARAIEAGRFRDVDAGVAALAIIGMCNWSAWWFVPHGRLSYTQVADQITDMAIAALLRGREISSQGQEFTSALAKAQSALAQLDGVFRGLKAG